MQKDTTFTKIFVGGLPYHTTDKSLGDFFEQFGEIEEAVVITDRQTGKSRGYGFVTMADAKAAERACRDPNPIIDGRKANVNLAYLGAKPRDIPNILSSLSSMSCLRPGFPGLIQASSYGLPQYIYPTSYLTSSAGGIALAPQAAATQAALAAQMQQAQMPQQQHLDPYSGAAAAAAYAQAQAQYAATAGIDPSAYASSPYAAAAAAAQSPYFASAPGYAAGYTLPSSAASQSLAAAFPAAYQQPQSQLQAAAGGDRV